MHIDDWDERFLSEFSPEVYFENLKRAKVTSAMIYLQSHVGLCHYPTKTGRMHRGFIGKENAVRTLAEMCHAEGIAVTGYYSLIFNTFENDRHPEWRLLNPDGTSLREVRQENGEEAVGWEFSGSRYGLCCPNNPQYREFTKQQIKEMAAYMDGHIDGMFYDMLYWPRMCCCDSCRERWAKEVGGEMPQVEDWHDPRWLLHMRKRREWIGEFAQWVTDTTKEYFGKNISVTHNVAYSALPNPTRANAEEVIAACDYAGGDINNTIYAQSFICKFYRGITRHQPFEFMIARCAPGLKAHTQQKSEDLLRSITALTIANHGAAFVIDAIDPVGTMDSRVYDRIGKIFGEIEPYEKYLAGKPVEDVGLYYSLKSKFISDDSNFSNYTGCCNTVETCIRKNLLVGVTGGYRTLDGHKLLIVPMLTQEDDYDVDRIAEYVANGGKVYFSGTHNQKLLKKFFNAKVVGRTKETVTYIAPEESAQKVFGYYNKKYPPIFNGSAPIVEGIPESCVLAKITLPYTTQDSIKFASIHSNPPGIPTDMPALAVTRYGKGRVVWSAQPIESCNIYDYRNILEGILKEYLDFDSTVTSDAPIDVELTLFQDEDRYIFASAQLSTEEKARKLENFTVKINLDKAPRKVTRLPECEDVPFTVNGTQVTFEVTAPAMLEMYEIKMA